MTTLPPVDRPTAMKGIRFMIMLPLYTLDKPSAQQYCPVTIMSTNP